MRSLRHGRGVGRRLGALITLGLLVTACGGGQASAPSAAASLNPQADKLAQILDSRHARRLRRARLSAAVDRWSRAPRAPAGTKCLPNQITGARR